MRDTSRLAIADRGNLLGSGLRRSRLRIDPSRWSGFQMSYDLVVWEGERPTTNRKALQAFHRMYDTYMNGEFTSASAQIQSFVGKLVERWPDVGEQFDADRECPWVHPPLISSASGPLIYVAVRSSEAATVVPFAIEVAAANGLVCFDPQTGELR
jgi:hypothetical protein